MILLQHEKAYKENMHILNRCIMKTFKERIADVSFHLQSLAGSEFFSQVQDAVERKDKNSLIRVCKKAKIPATYIGTVVSVLLSVHPEQKWPPVF
jgi:hypothetical protein